MNVITEAEPPSRHVRLVGSLYVRDPQQHYGDGVNASQLIWPSVSVHHFSLHSAVLICRVGMAKYSILHKNVEKNRPSKSHFLSGFDFQAANPRATRKQSEGHMKAIRRPQRSNPRASWKQSAGHILIDLGPHSGCLETRFAPRLTRDKKRWAVLWGDECYRCDWGSVTNVVSNYALRHHGPP